MFTAPDQACLDHKYYAQAHTFDLHALPDLMMDPGHSSSVLKKLESFLQEYENCPVLFCAETLGRRENLSNLLKNHVSDLTVVANWEEFMVRLQSQPALRAITVGYLENGFRVNKNFIVIAEANLLGRAQIKVQKKRGARYTDSDLFIRNLAELSLNDPIVHIDHGVGRYAGLEMLKIGGQEAEFLKIIYEGGNLFVPVDNLHLISRYQGMDTEHAPLHRLGSDTWDKAKKKALEQIRDVAAELLALYATRAAKPGFAYPEPGEDYHAFVAAFPFEATADQASVMEQVLEDMISPLPMDRLVCGDVGFGKTEVAMRAAFFAVSGGKQVAILVPTTLLAQQHFETFSNRFANFPIKIEVLSRFRSAKEQKNILLALSEGKVDIVIGTHKLLNSEVKFKDLGLLVVDEEHRFGVRQKEQLKQLSAHVDFLTMTATPIPRSLNMALSSVRNLSLITTPPAKRLSVKTFVREFDWALIREAIQREVLRGGQVYFLHNDVVSIERMAEDLRSLLPELRLGVAHGQMTSAKLEQVMMDFYHQRFTVLLCSTIIETGIDVPHANTIIINRADKLGLAQLHQLRGRVGRSHHQAYAYLLAPSLKSLSADARRRLEAIEALEELGVGFALATHDLEIRGAGELLGENQSGHIQAIGYTLYTEILNQAVEALKKGDLPEDLLQTIIPQDCEIKLPFSCFIPEEYMADVNMRLVFYKRIAAAEDARALLTLKSEIIDRFGLLSDPVKNLFHQMEIKKCAMSLGLKRLDAQENMILFEFLPDAAITYHEKIIKLLQTQPQKFKLKGSYALKVLGVNLELNNPEAFFAELKKILELFV